MTEGGHTVRLLSAELTKLWRPLTWCVVALAVLVSALFAWQGARNAPWR